MSSDDATPKGRWPERHRVRLEGSAVLVERLSVDDPVLARLIKERIAAGAGAEDAVRGCLEVGARALASAGAGPSLERLRAALEQSAEDAVRRLAETSAELERRLREAMDRNLDPQGGVLSRAMAFHHAQMARFRFERFGSGGDEAVQAGLVCAASSPAGQPSAQREPGPDRARFSEAPAE